MSYRKGKCRSFLDTCAVMWEVWHSAGEPRPVQCSQANVNGEPGQRLGRRYAVGCRKSCTHGWWMYGRSRRSKEDWFYACLHTSLRDLQIRSDVQELTALVPW